MFCPLHNLRRIFTLISSVGQSDASIYDIAWVRKEIKETVNYYVTLISFF